MALAAALLAAVVVPSHSRAAVPTVQTAYWWAGTGATPPGVPDGGLYVSSQPSGPTAVSALRLRSPRSTTDARLVLRVHTLHVVDAMTLGLLPSTTSWVPGNHQPWTGKPGYDQQLTPTAGSLSADRSTVSFDLGAMSRDETRDVVLLPARAFAAQPGFAPDAPSQSFDVSFDPATAGALVVAAGAPRTVLTTGVPPAPTPRPGPELLYAPEATAPQLENRPGGPWHAAPLLVSGAEAYSRGEYLYQGFLYDDHGAAGAADPNDPFTKAFLFAAKAGTLTYPTDRAFVNNAADLLELRLRAERDDTVFRTTFTSLVDPSRTAFTLALGTSTTPHPWPASAGVGSPAALFVTVHGGTAEVRDAATGTVVRPGATVLVDLARHQYEVHVPHATWNPGTRVQRVTAGAGLWDVAAGHYLLPGTTATATAPGGVAPSQSALFDVGFRFAETMPDWSHMGLAYTIADAAVVEQADQKCFWRDCQQADALRTGDLTRLHANVDFGRLARGVTDLSHVPTTGYLDRIHPSRLSFGQGVDPARTCGRFPVTCTGMFVGNLQPYQVYVPTRRRPTAGWGMTVMLHASGANHNERMGSRMERQLADRGSGSVVVTALARDPNGDYTDATEAEVFDTWADVARHYPLDPSRTAVVGYSMGGGGTYKMVQRWPDLFAAGFGAAAVVFDDGWQGQWFPGMLNVPMLTWIGSADEASGNNIQLIQVHDMELYGFRFQIRQFTTSDHLTIATNDAYSEAASWLGDRRVATNPSRVSFVVDTRSDFPGTTMVASHAYWLADLTVRDRAKNPAGSVEAHSLGLGQADPRIVDRSTSAGTMNGGYHGPMPYVQTGQDWGPSLARPRVDHLDLQLHNLATAAVDLSRAGLDCHATVSVHSDGPARVSFPACGLTAHLPAGTTSLSLTAPMLSRS